MTVAYMIALNPNMPIGLDTDSPLWNGGFLSDCVAPAIGIMLLNVAFGSNAGVYSETGGPFCMMRDFFGAWIPSFAQASMGPGYSQMVLNVITAFIGRAEDGSRTASIEYHFLKVEYPLLLSEAGIPK